MTGPLDSIPPLSPPPWLRQRLLDIDVELDPGDIEQLGDYLGRLLAANREFNLTGIREPEDAWQKHIVDSLTLFPILSALEAGSVADVGSGGGLPGIPLAICMPQTQFTLFEATGKKAKFLESVTESLGLKNIEVVNERVETAAEYGAKWRDQFDAVVARAVGPLRVLIELTIPLAREGGSVLAVKGEKAEEELEAASKALRLLNADATEIIPTPTGRIVVIEKIGRTARTYPRRPGEPKRMPLGSE